MDSPIAINKKLWDGRVAAHLASDFYDMAAFRQGQCSLPALDVELMGPVEGLSLLHLQCHFGQDTLSWARRGATTKGIDLSEKAVEAAQRISQELNIKAEFVAANVLEYQPQQTFDRVYTSYGVLGWLPDLQRWAKVVADSLKPGGRFVLVEFHPTLMMFDFPTGQLKFDYFHKLLYEEVQGTYADPGASIGGGEYTWSHSLADVLTPLLTEGLRLVEFRELDWSPYSCFEGMEERSPGQYVYTKASAGLPHLFAMVMEKPNS